MGLRGPGAKPVRQSKPRAGARPSWQRPGLSRSDRVITFIESLKLTAGRWAGKRFRLRAWQKDIIRRVYVPVGPNGRRLVRTALVTMGRKNGKTQLAAALALAHLCGPEAEPRGEVYSAAADRNQAARIFRELEAFVVADPDLHDRINIQRFIKRLEVLAGPGAGSMYEPLSSDARKAHGLSPSFVVCDELAQWHSRELYDNLVTGSGARAEPLVVVISTQSSDPHHVLSQLIAYADQVEAGTVTDPTFTSALYRVPLDADPWDERLWALANPALGDFLDPIQLRTEARRAQRMPSAESAFRSAHLNQPVESETRFLNGADWDACNAPVDPDSLLGRSCWGSLDLGSTQDLCAFDLIFPGDDGIVDVLCWFWCPADRLRERAERDRVPYPTWRSEGYIETTPGRATDRGFIAAKIAQLAAAYDIKNIAYDRWRIEELRPLLADEGVRIPLVPFGQGFRDMGPAVDALETHVLERRLRHGGHPVLRWNAANAVVVADAAGNRKLCKDRSREKIDGLVALAMALGQHAKEPKAIPFDLGRAFRVLTV